MSDLKSQAELYEEIALWKKAHREMLDERDEALKRAEDAECKAKTSKSVNRRNPRVETLEREIDLLRKQIKRMHEDPGDIPFIACDNSCIVANATGMATNGGCRCNEHTLRRAVAWWRRIAEFRALTIRELRDELAEAAFQATIPKEQ